MRLCATTAAATALLVTAGPLTASAVAAGTADTAAPPVAPAAVQAQQSRAEVRVDAFLRDYRQATLHKGKQTPAQVRAKYLTPELNKRLDAWADLHDADPVFRAQNVPDSWTTRYEGSGMGHTTVVVTERWGSGATQDVWYQVRLDSLVISDLQDPPK
ncbi:hypothetical protein [Streptomyces sp. UNOC14_S4]|uniref:hypothetical protein n=1 Tax=Streptomyces sp. UNOC14_S4 TaxID=2872340 RepID=UPI001E371796|nr:hypothetical protein [Streptomyces sp. UNOC14_S4]MCC3766900.1 hypothetical protein [Streptomyces sp. UNOC14_S4]